jgi:hypothetical protein
MFFSVILLFPQSFNDFLSYFVRHRGGEGRGVDGRGVGCRRTRHSPAGRRGAEEVGVLAREVSGGGGRGARWWWGGVGLGCTGLGVAGSIGRREVGQVAWGQTGGVGEAGTRAGAVG